MIRERETEAAAERRGMERAVAMLREMAAFDELDPPVADALHNAAAMIAATAARSAR